MSSHREYREAKGLSPAKACVCVAGALGNRDRRQTREDGGRRAAGGSGRPALTRCIIRARGAGDHCQMLR